MLELPDFTMTADELVLCSHKLRTILSKGKFYDYDRQLNSPYGHKHCGLLVMFLSTEDKGLKVTVRRSHTLLDDIETALKRKDLVYGYYHKLKDESLLDKNQNEVNLIAIQQKMQASIPKELKL